MPQISLPKQVCDNSPSNTVQNQQLGCRQRPQLWLPCVAAFWVRLFHLCMGGGWKKLGIDWKKRFRLFTRKPFFTWWAVIYRSRLVLREVLQPPSLVIPKPPLAWSPEQSAQILHVILLGAGDWATDLLWFLLPCIILWSHECLQLPWTSTCI